MDETSDPTPDEPSGVAPPDPPDPPDSLAPLDPPTLTDLPPLEDEIPAKRRLFSGVRLAAVGVVAVAALAGGAVLALGGDDDADDNDGIASVDGTEDSETGDGTSGNGSRMGAEDEAEFQDAALEYAQCMRDHGVDMPDPEFDGEGGVMMSMGPDSGTPSEMEAADEACQPIMEDVMPEMDLSPEEQAEMQDQQLAMAACMRERGYDFPDPEVGPNGEVSVRARAGSADGAPGPAPGSPEDDQFHEDMDECAEEAGLEGPRFGGGSNSADDEGDT